MLLFTENFSWDFMKPMLYYVSIYEKPSSFTKIRVLFLEGTGLFVLQGT